MPAGFGVCPPIAYKTYKRWERGGRASQRCDRTRGLSTPARADGPGPASPPDALARGWLALLLALLLAPCLWLAYLPMTDLPQHLALASILLHHDDPRFGFAAYYDVASGQSLYWLQSLLALALAGVIGLEAGMRVVVVLSLALLPVAVLALLRSLRKPEWLALLALPLVYNRAFFWGFTSFQLALGFEQALAEKTVHRTACTLLGSTQTRVTSTGAACPCVSRGSCSPTGSRSTSRATA
jgi:hypothetical protein